MSENKQPWLETVPGIHPALRDLTPTEEEVKALGESMGRVMMSDRQKFIEVAMREVENCIGNINLFRGQKRKGMADMQIEPLARAYAKLGRFAQALNLLTKNGRCLPGRKKLVAEIKEIQQAIERPDEDEDCTCDRSLAVIDGPGNKPVQIALNRRYVWGEVWSEKHKEVVSIWICSMCGDANAHNKTPSRQLAVYQARASVAATITSVHKEIPAHFSDAVLLKLS
jgi:hypothetical protein